MRDVLLFRIQLSLSQQISRFFLITISRPGVGKPASIGTRAQYPVPAKLVRRKSHSYSAGRRIPVTSNPAFETGAIPPVTSFDRKAKIWSVVRSEERRVGKECRSRLWPEHVNKIG